MKVSGLLRKWGVGGVGKKAGVRVIICSLEWLLMTAMAGQASWGSGSQGLLRYRCLSAEFLGLTKGPFNPRGCLEKSLQVWFCFPLLFDTWGSLVLRWKPVVLFY